MGHHPGVHGRGINHLGRGQRFEHHGAVGSDVGNGDRAQAFGDVEFVACGEAARRAREDAGIERKTLTPVTVEPGLYPDA